MKCKDATMRIYKKVLLGTIVQSSRLSSGKISVASGVCSLVLPYEDDRWMLGRNSESVSV